jgi:hypothetical protein
MTKEFQKQVKKDIDIIVNKLDDNITKIEWHAVNGIDEVVLKYIQTELRSNNIPIDKFQVILY